jgi:hypothetical protein
MKEETLVSRLEAEAEKRQAAEDLRKKLGMKPGENVSVSEKLSDEEKPGQFNLYLFIKGRGEEAVV